MKKYRVTIFILLVCLLSGIAINAQDRKNGGISDRIFFGGDFWLSIGTNTYIDIAPLIGYKITPRLSAGLGPIYIFQKDRLNYLDTIINNIGYYRTYNIKYNTYGGRFFMTYDLIKDMNRYIPLNIGTILVHCENEALNIETVYRDIYTYRYYLSGNRLWIDNLLVGAGLRQPIGRRAAVNLLILWDITENKYSPHSNPIFRMGFSF